MSGICALYRIDDRPIDRRSLDRMVDALKDWGDGPADSWVDESGRAGLGCHLMGVTPEDAFDLQPRRSVDGSCVLVADARLDNRPELAEALRIPRREAATMPDSAFILAAYTAWGEDCARRLVGDFAFVLWDASRRILFCARDPFGQRVLYAYRTSRFLAVSSSIASLLAVDDVPRRLNEQKVAELLVLLENARTTCFDGIERLLPAHTMSVSAAGVTERRYWSADPERRIALRSDAEYVEGFREVFGRAVRDRLRSAKPVAIMLSAGLDSTSVAGVAAQALRSNGGRLLAFHSAPRRGFEGDARRGWVNDESAELTVLAGLHDNIDLTVVRGQDAVPLDDAGRLFRVMGSPIRNSLNLTWIRAIYERAAASGAGVMLNGSRGNHTISYTGLLTLRDLARRGRVVPALREARALAEARGHRLRDVLKDQILLPLMPASVLGLYHRLRKHAPSPIWETSLSAIRPELARERRLDEVAIAMREDEPASLRMSAFEYRLRGLTGPADGYDVAHSFRSWVPVETREPAADVRVVEFCLAIPGTQYLHDGRDRLLIRRGMRDVVPASILDRTTRGAQAADWPVWFGRMRQGIREELDRLDRIDTARRCLDLTRLRRLVDEWPASLRTEHTAEYGLRLMRGIMMGRFIRWFEEESR